MRDETTIQTGKLRLISTDFDGTLFAEFEQPPIPLELLELIHELQGRGVKWVINTGREMTSLMESLARARVTVQPDFLVLVEREIYVHDGARYVPLQPWNDGCAEDHAKLFARVEPDVPALMDWVNANFEATVYADPWSPFCLIAGNNGDADVIHDRMRSYAATIPNLTVVRNDVYARFCHAAYNKGTALAEVARRTGVRADQILAAGDHLNDLPMLQRDYATALVCPANAVAAVRAAVGNQAGFVAQRPGGLGVSDGIRHFLAAIGA